MINTYWANYIEMFSWNILATIRLHYKISETSADRMTTALIKYKKVNGLFYSLEYDRAGGNHIHLLLDTESSMSSLELASGIGKYEKSVTYFENVKSKKAVSNYCTKHLGKGIMYDLKIK